MKFKRYYKTIQEDYNLGGMAGVFGQLGNQGIPKDEYDDDEYDTQKPNAIVFDFYGTLIKLRKSYEDIILLANWIDYPIDDFDIDRWEELFVLVPDSVYNKAEQDKNVEFYENKLCMNEEIIHKRYERDSKPPNSYIRTDHYNGVSVKFGPGIITNEILDFFTQNFKSERFIRIAKNYDAFIMKGWGKEVSSREKYFSKFSETVLSSENFGLLHQMGPAINMLKDVDLDTTDIHIVAGFNGSDELNYIIADICGRFGVKLHPTNNVHVIGWSSKKTANNERQNKIKLLKELKQQYQKVTLVDDSKFIARSSEVRAIAETILV